MSAHEGKTGLHQLPEKAQWVNKIPGLASYLLISVTKLCDAGCEVNLTQIGFEIKYKERAILCGKKCMQSGLWMIPITNKPDSNEAELPTPQSTFQQMNAMQISRELVSANSPAGGETQVPTRGATQRVIPTNSQLQQTKAVQEESNSKYTTMANVTATMRATIATTEGASTIEEIEEIATP